MSIPLTNRYLPIVPILIVLANLGNNYYLRLHHYIYSLVAIPVLSLPNRVSLFLQAMLFGLFLDGVGRWGWASIVESGDSVRPFPGVLSVADGQLLGDSNAGTYTPSFLNTSTATQVSWTGLNETYTEVGITGFSLIIDDVQRLFDVRNSSKSDLWTEAGWKLIISSIAGRFQSCSGCRALLSFGGKWHSRSPKSLADLVVCDGRDSFGLHQPRDAACERDLGSVKGRSSVS